MTIFLVQWLEIVQTKTNLYNKSVVHTKIKQTNTIRKIKNKLPSEPLHNLPIMLALRVLNAQFNPEL